MQNKELAKAFKLTAQLLELHNENPFKVKSYNNAALKIDKLDLHFAALSIGEIENIEGIGKSIAAAITEFLNTGTSQDLNKLTARTPSGVIEMLAIKGIGPKKIQVIWKELQIESIGELLYACNENRLTDLKGFGLKTQEMVKKAIEFKLSNSGKFHYALAEQTAYRLIEFVKSRLNTPLISLTGEIRRKCEIIEKIDLLIGSSEQPNLSGFDNPANIPVNIINSSPELFYWKLFETTGNKEHLHKFESITKLNTSFNYSSEEEIYTSKNLQFIVPELREGYEEIELAGKNQISPLVELSDLKGILHIHTKYSDGIHSLEEMARHAKELGFQYIGITDHSQSAFYANGLKPDKILLQHREIDTLNQELAPFKIFKGIESDILNNGLLDYPDDVLKSFDFVIASVHSNLKMTLEKATERLLKAIENPYTTILGHMTGRLLLSREGYPVDHKSIIDACLKHHVIIELNAHPYRLDMDWRWIKYAIEKGVKISINPDAHQKQGYSDMHYGICIAKKGCLTKEMTFNSLSKDEMENYFNGKKNNRIS